MVGYCSCAVRHKRFLWQGQGQKHARPRFCRRKLYPAIDLFHQGADQALAQRCAAGQVEAGRQAAAVVAHLQLEMPRRRPAQRHQ